MTLLAIDWLLLIEKLVLIAIIVFASLGIALYTTFAERKVAAVCRTGPVLTVQAFWFVATFCRWFETDHERRDHSEHFQ
jgi:NADH:ubiquinone oxidoreductase subunit H